MIIQWKILAPNLTAYQVWHSAYNEVFRKLTEQGVRRDYVLNWNMDLRGIHPPTVIGCLKHWSNNPRYADPERIIKQLNLMNYQYDKAHWLEWAGVYIIPHSSTQKHPAQAHENSAVYQLPSDRR
jgi:hypothetical protein